MKSDIAFMPIIESCDAMRGGTRLAPTPEWTMPTTTIVLADDEAHITHVLRLKLESRGYRVHIASDGQEAFDLVLEHRPDLVITDLQMPVWSGFDLAVHMRSDPRAAHIPIIMLTARGHTLSKEDLARTNIRHLLPKPFSAREVETLARELLDSDANTPPESLAA